MTTYIRTRQNIRYTLYAERYFYYTNIPPFRWRNLIIFPEFFTVEFAESIFGRIKYSRYDISLRHDESLYCFGALLL